MPMDPELRATAEAARGFMPPDEGLTLYEAGVDAAATVPGAPLLEVGSYCGKSSVYLGAAAKAAGTVLVAVDHHRGSEENQPGWEFHEPDLVDADIGRIDTLPIFRRTVHGAGLEDIHAGCAQIDGRGAIVGPPGQGVAAIDGGHGDEPADQDYRLWSPHVAPGGLLAIHDVFPDPADGGRPPYERIYLPALASGRFEEVSATGSLRVLRRTP